MELIPGLPNDIAVDCLIRFHFDQFPKAAIVCKDWTWAIQLPEFWRRRKAAGFTEPVIVVAQARSNPPRNQLAVWAPENGFWCELPPIPGCFHGLPMFCQLVGVGKKLVVLGGCDPVTWKVTNSVFIYDFLTATWWSGANMPGGQRLFFGCASDNDRRVLVAGGHDDSKNALRTAMMYDVAKDEWVMLADMARERDECNAVFHGGKFHVIGGYCTERQGSFEKDAEVFNIQTRQWEQVQDLSEVATCSRGCVCRVETQNSTLAKLPAEVHDVVHMTAWQSKLYVIGSVRSSSGPLVAYVINLENGSLTNIEVPFNFKNPGHIQSAVCLEI